MSEAQMKVSDEIAISIENMNKWYGTFHVLRDINLDVQRGERIVICGPSGSGKIHPHPLHQCSGGASTRIHHSRRDAVVLRCEEH